MPETLIAEADTHAGEDTNWATISHTGVVGLELPR